MIRPFLLNFKSKLDTSEIDLEDYIVYNEEKQRNEINIADPILMWKVWYTSVHTQGKYIKGHRSRTNKWISGHYRKSKKDRRKGR